MHSPAPPVDLSALNAGRPLTDREKQVLDTRTGLGVLMLAVLLQWIPVIEYLGVMIGAVGVFYVVRGRRAFGRRHGVLVWASIILFVATEVTAFGLDNELTYALSVAAYSLSGPNAASYAVAVFTGMAVGSAIISAFQALCFVLLVFDLEDRDGREWLLAGLATQIVVSAALYVWILLPMVQQSVPQAYLTSPPDSAILAAADAQIRGFSLLRVLDWIPAPMFAWAYWRAVLRIDRGEVPPAILRSASGGPRSNPP